KIREQNEQFAPKPDILIILDLDVDTALQRIGVRDGQANEFEKRESLDFCRTLFLSLEGEPYAHVISAQASIEDVHAAVAGKVRELLEADQTSAR
ncbi:MAG: dTMP kinase, partial [Akkermansiaceae bacterium]